KSISKTPSSRSPTPTARCCRRSISIGKCRIRTKCRGTRPSSRVVGAALFCAGWKISVMPEDRHLTARKAPSRGRLAQLVRVIPDRRFLHFSVFGVLREQVRSAGAGVAVEFERRIGDHVEHLRAAE